MIHAGVTIIPPIFQRGIQIVASLGGIFGSIIARPTLCIILIVLRGIADVKGHVHGISGVIFAVVKVGISLDGVIVVLFGDFDPNAGGVRECACGEIIEVSVGVCGG